MACSQVGPLTGQYDQNQAARSCSSMTGVIGEDLQVPEMGVVYIFGLTEIAECNVDSRGVTIVSVF